MFSTSQLPHGLRFGIFEIDLDARELRKNGLRVKLQDQPFKILAAMACRAGEVIPREELYSELSTHSTYDSKHGLNNAIQKIREVLGDSPENARFIETVAGRGYRFLPHVEVVYMPFVRDTSREPATSARPVESTTPLQPPEIEPSFFHRFFLLFGDTPFRRWEIAHARMAIWCVLLGCLGWRFMLSAPDRWGPRLFFLQLACIGFLLLLLGFLIYTGAFNFSGLAGEVRRMTFWVRWLTVGLVLVTWMMAGTVAVSHPILATLLALCSALGSLKYMLFKTAVDRAAFPDALYRAGVGGADCGACRIMDLAQLAALHRDCGTSAGDSLAGGTSPGKSYRRFVARIFCRRNDRCIDH